MPILGAGYVGDYAEDYATLNLKFTSYSTAWVPIALAGTPVIKVYAADETATEVTTGITLAVDFDGVVGLNNVLIDLSSAAFYAVAKDYHVIITTGTLDSVSTVGTMVGSFSIENRFGEVDVTKWLGTGVAATTAGRPDVNMKAINNSIPAVGKLALWFDEAKSGTADSGTTTTMVDSARNEADDAWIGAVLLFTGETHDPRAVLVTAFDAATDTITFTPALPSDVTTGTYLLLPGFGLAGVEAWVGSVPNALISGRVDVTVDATGMETGAVDNILTRQMTEAYAANGVAPTLAQSLFAIHQMLMQFGISGTSITIRKLDDTGTAFVVTLDDATSPTDAKRV